MSYLKFDKNQLINLDQSLRKEMLRTNQSGAYHCTTLTDCNTRRQHGLLVIPLPGPGGEPHVLLSSLDETVVQHGVPFNLAVHRYDGGVYAPNGHKYIREFDCESVPRTTYRVGGVILTKEKIFISHENRILIRYTLVEAHSPTTLRLRPLLAFRHANAICVANDALDTTLHEAPNGLGCCLYPGYPTLYLQTSKPTGFESRPDWYRHFEYIKDRERTQHESEDLWSPGYFEMPIEPGESVIFSAGTSEVAPGELQLMYENEIKSRTCRTSFFNCLKNAAKQFYLRDGDDMYLITTYPWGSIRARDIFIALPGATLCIDHHDDFTTIMRTATRAVDRFLESGEGDPVIKDVEAPDVPLWAIRCVQTYADMHGLDAARERYAPFVRSVIESLLADRHPNFHVDDRGLVETAGAHTPVSWASATLPGDNRPLVPRTGYLVELNALWYNALRFSQELLDNGTQEGMEFIERIGALVSTLSGAFISTFLNEAGYLWDYVDPLTGPNVEVRPNMAIAIGLKYTPLNRRQRRGVLDVITRELLTPKGLRTLSPKSGAYRPRYVGSDHDRAMARYNGTVRPWLIGFYTDAYLNIFGLGGAGVVDRMLISFEDEMQQGCIGSLAQLYDGNPPYDGHGAISHCCNVAEVLRSLTTLRDFERAEDLKFEQALAGNH